MEKEKTIKLKDTTVACWLKNNEEWYYPVSKETLDLHRFKHVELLSTSSVGGHLIYAWDDDKEFGRLFRTK